MKKSRTNESKKKMEMHCKLILFTIVKNHRFGNIIYWGPFVWNGIFSLNLSINFYLLPAFSPGKDSTINSGEF